MAIGSKIVMKVMSIAVGIPVRKATNSAVEGTWRSLRPGDEPRSPAERDVKWVDAIGWAALSAAGIVVAELATRRGAEELWRFFVGTEPPPKKPSKAARKLEQAAEKAELEDAKAEKKRAKAKS